MKSLYKEQGEIMKSNTENKSLIGQLNNFEVNVGIPERIASTVAGGALVAFGIKQGGIFGTVLSLLGGGLVLRGATGHCSMYEALDIDGSSEEKLPAENVHVVKSLTINKSAAELFAFWRDFENLSQIMMHLESVTEIDNKRSHWKAKAPVGASVEWEAEITSERENEFIEWSSVENSDVANSGKVEFLPTQDRGTEVKVTLHYQSPGGKIGSLFAKFFGEEPEQQVAEDLRRLKQLMESGTIMTIEGQSSGRKTQAKTA